MAEDAAPYVPLPPSTAGAVPPELVPCPPPSAAGELPEPLRRLLTDFTGAGDLVVTLDDAVPAAGWSGRRHLQLPGDSHLVALGALAGTVQLLLLPWPRRGVNPLHLLRACRALLGDGGVLATVQAAREDRVASLSALAGAAGNADLVLIRHLVAIDMAMSGRLRRLLRPHTDVLAFMPRAAAPEPAPPTVLPQEER